MCHLVISLILPLLSTTNLPPPVAHTHKLTQHAHARSHVHTYTHIYTHARAHTGDDHMKLANVAWGGLGGEGANGGLQDEDDVR